MAMQNFTLSTARIAKFKGQILKHAVPFEVLGRTGRQVPFPKNNSDTYVARRWLPYGATATSAASQNQFFQNGTGDRGNVIVQAHQTQEASRPPRQHHPARHHRGDPAVQLPLRVTDLLASEPACRPGRGRSLSVNA